MEIKFGDIRYFTLLRLQSTLKSVDFNRLGLLSYDKLRLEVDMKVEEIHLHDKMEREAKKDLKNRQRKFDFWCSCMVYHRPKEMCWFFVCPVCDKRINKLNLIR